MAAMRAAGLATGVAQNRLGESTRGPPMAARWPKIAASGNTRAFRAGRASFAQGWRMLARNPRFRILMFSINAHIVPWPIFGGDGRE